MNREKIAALVVTLFVLCLAVGLSGGCLINIIVGFMEDRHEMPGVFSDDSLRKLIFAIICTWTVCSIVLIKVMLLFNRMAADALIKQTSQQYEAIRSQNLAMKRKVRYLQNAYAATEKTNKAKSKFLSRMSHDLRTPMNAIVGYSMLMEQVSDDPEKVNYYAGKITISSHTLMELINDVLDMNCIETGNVRLVNHPFSLAAAIEEVTSAIRPQMRGKNQNFEFVMSNETDQELIVGDKQRLCQIIRNILSNATKYTPEEGQVKMTVRIYEEADIGVQMLCRISDTGCGISREFMRQLFSPFEREQNSENESIAGTGLGMCIAKSFVELMNGTITVESELGKGTDVEIRIPLTPAIKEKKRTRHPFYNEGILKGLRFLAAEDNESNAEILCEVLSAMGAECVITGNGQEVVEVFENSEVDEFDIILMDIQMPIMNGYQATTAIRKCSHPRARNVVIVAMTADAFEEDVQKAFVSGMNAHVAKPLDMQSFINTIKSLNFCL